MKNKKIKNLFLEENEKLNIEMSDELKRTPIQPPVEEAPAPVKRKPLMRLLPMGAIACVLIIAVMLAIINPFSSSNGTLTAYVIDINPSISITTDENDTVISICSLNNDADELLSSNEFDTVVGESLDTAVGKIIKAVSDKGILDGYEDKIRIYALNDDKKIMDKRLDEFGRLVRKNLDDEGFKNIEFEEREMTVGEFKDRMGFEKEFVRLDEMKDDIKNHDRMHGGELPPPKPDGDTTPPPEPRQ